MKPKISIVVPVYKVEKYLCECIDSILRQTFSQFELILVDDGSPDGCSQICDDYAVRDSRIRVCHKMNGGVSQARNCGISMALADWITFIDGDDYVSPTYLQSLYRPCKNNDEIQFVHCGSTNVRGGKLQ